MEPSSRKGKQQQTQKSITPFTVGNTKMAGDQEATLNLQTIRNELRTYKDVVLAEIKAEIWTSFREIKMDIAALRSETKADVQALQDELMGANPASSCMDCSQWSVWRNGQVAEWCDGQSGDVRENSADTDQNV